MPGNKFGTNLSVSRSRVEPLAARYPIPNTPDRPGASGPRCGVSPGSTSFSWSPGPVESAGASFILVYAGGAFPCGLALPLPSSRNGRGQGWDGQGEGLAGRLGVGLGLASIRPGTLP